MAANLVVERTPRERLEEGFRLLLPQPDESQQAWIGSMIDRARQSPEAVDGLFWATVDSQPIAAIWVDESPGAVAHLIPPLASLDPQVDVASDRLFAEAALWIARRRLPYAQTLLESPTPDVVERLVRAGYRHVCDVTFMSRSLAGWIVAGPSEGVEKPASPIAFRPWREVEVGLARRLVARTYVGSLDCPIVDGWRDVADTLAGYAAAGARGDELWRALVHAGELVGVMLVADHWPPGGWELMYLGIAPEFRGRGWSRAAIDQLIDEATRHGAPSVDLAVDTRNLPARRVYEERGFAPVSERSVFARRF